MDGQLDEKGFQLKGFIWRNFFGLDKEGGFSVVWKLEGTSA